MKISIGLLALCFLIACNSEYVPRPRGYYRIELPPKNYQVFDRPNFPYSFEYPVYGEIIRDSLFFEERTENDYWLNIDFPSFGGRIHLSYKEIGRHNLDSLIDDAFELSYKQHTYKASSIDQQPFTTPTGSGGVYFTLKGDAATANQFFITDSVKHFIRGALYFNATPNADSLQPVNAFLKKDVEKLISTLQWKR